MQELDDLIRIKVRVLAVIFDKHQTSCNPSKPQVTCSKSSNNNCEGKSRYKHNRWQALNIFKHENINQFKMLKIQIDTGWNEENIHKHGVGFHVTVIVNGMNEVHQRWNDVGKHTNILINCRLTAV